MSRGAQSIAAGDGKAAFTGERFLPECSGEIAYEHWHRYVFARSFVEGKVVLDVACGEGYGAALLSTVAAVVHGVDIAADTVRQAASKYTAENLRFVQASCTALPFRNGSVDVIVSFETIEHIDEESQLRMLEEFDRLLKPEGILILSSPNKAEYSDIRDVHNEFHVRELYRDDLARLLKARFEALRWFNQRVQCWSGIWSEPPATEPIEAIEIDNASVYPYGSPRAMYYVLIAARSDAALARPLPRGSILTDRGDSVGRRYEAAVGQLIEQYKLVDKLTAACDQHGEHVLHLEQIVRERDDAIRRQDLHVRHLEGLVLERDRVIEQLMRRVSELQTSIAEQDTAIGKARGEALAFQREVEGLRSADQENRDAVSRLTERVMQLTETISGMYSWRWWLRFPVSRGRRGTPPR